MNDIPVQSTVNSYNFRQPVFIKAADTSIKANINQSVISNQ